jgi:hypothetical protein
MRILTGLAGSLMVLALAVTGCGSDDADKEPNGGASPSTGDKSAGVIVDACKLLTPADLKEKFGSPFGGGELTHQEDSGADQCVWTSADDSPAKTFSATVLRQDGLDDAFGAGGLAIAQLFEQTKAAYPNAEAVDLGDEAYVAVTEVQVLDGGTWYSFSIHGAGDGAVEGVKELAAQVVGRP